ncbi:unnamed protein product [Dicrocoelium dendriticum]|nr:unnamed protein product [Dicrocoelium dendriticum]
MGERLAGNQIPVSVRIPVSSIRPTPRPIGTSSSVNFTRAPMVNPVYLLPKSGLSNAPSVMQVRSCAGGQTAAVSNGVVTGSAVFSRTSSGHPVGSSTPNAAKLVGFLNQLLELSKNVAADVHAAVVRLIQALVNAELDANSFCTQLRANLKSANTSTDIGPFIKDNIDALRADLASGACRLSNINPPTGPLIKDVLSSPFSSVPAACATLSMSGPGPVTVQVRAPVTACFPAGPNSSTLSGSRLSVPSAAGSQPRLVGTLLNSISSPVPSAVITTSPNRSYHSQPPLLAPAPPRTSFTATGMPATPLPAPSAGSVPKYRLAQTLSNVMTPSNAATTSVATTRLTQTPTTVKSSYSNLRPILAPAPSASGSATVNLAAVRPTPTIAPLVRTKLGAPLSSPSTLPLTSARLGSQLSASTLLSDRTLVTDRTQELSGSEDSRICLLSPSKDQPFFPPSQIRSVLSAQLPNLTLSEEAITCLSHGLQSLMNSILTRLSIVVSHRLERLGDDPRLTQLDNTREQLKFLQRLDEHDQMRQFELEKDLILKAAKSRSRNEDPDQVRVREMARRIATEDYEREKQNQANLTALHAIGPQRKRRLDTVDESAPGLPSDSSLSSSTLVSLVDGIPSGSAHPRLSLVSTNRIASLPAASSFPLSRSSTELSQTSSLSVVSTHTLSNALTAPDTSSRFSLAHSSRVHRATLKDVQLVLSRTPRLRRSLTFYRTHWRSS